MAYRLIGEQLFDDNGEPLNTGEVSVYEAGTTSDKDSFPTADDADAGTNANTNPVVLDSAGRGQIWGKDGETYKLVIKTSAGVTLDTIDDIKTPPPKSLTSDYVVSAGTSSAITATPSPAWAEYAAGRSIRLKITTTCAASPTLNVSGLGAKNIKTLDGNAALAGDLFAGGVCDLVYDGTNFILLNPCQVKGTYTGTGVGFSGTAPTMTVTYVKQGYMVTVDISSTWSGSTTSNATGFEITGAPAIIIPSTTPGYQSCLVTDNGSTAAGRVRMRNNGTITFINGNATTTVASFTGSGTKGIPVNVTFSYSLT